MKNGFVVRNTFNHFTISQHKTLEAAARAEAKYQRSYRKTVKKHSPYSYMPTSVLKLVDGVYMQLLPDELDIYTAEYHSNLV